MEKKNPPSFSPSVINKMSRKLKKKKKKNRIRQIPFQRQTQKEVNRQFPGWLLPTGACPVGLKTFQLYDLGKDRILDRRKLV